MTRLHIEASIGAGKGSVDLLAPNRVDSRGFLQIPLVDGEGEVLRRGEVHSVAFYFRYRIEQFLESTAP
jgi:hypothetical protein